MILYILLFLVSISIFYIAGKFIVESIERIARFLGWREFVVAFIIMASAASLPNLIVGISAGLRGVPQLALGDIAGNNLIDLTLGIAIIAMFAMGGIPVESKLVLKSSWFVMVAAILPLLLALNGYLSRIDGLIMISLFVVYMFWLFSRKEQFKKTYNSKDTKASLSNFKIFLKDIAFIFLGIILFVVAAQGIIVSAEFFSVALGLSLLSVGILITAFGSALPEIYFGILAAKKSENWLILGDMMGAVIIPSTLVLGLVALFFPIQVHDFSSLAIARIFVIIAALLFPIFVRTQRKITKKEALILLFIYIVFLLTQVFFKI